MLVFLVSCKQSEINKLPHTGSRLVGDLTRFGPRARFRYRFLGPGSTTVSRSGSTTGSGYWVAGWYRRDDVTRRIMDGWFGYGRLEQINRCFTSNATRRIYLCVSFYFLVASSSLTFPCICLCLMLRLSC